MTPRPPFGDTPSLPRQRGTCVVGTPRRVCDPDVLPGSAWCSSPTSGSCGGPGGEWVRPPSDHRLVWTTESRVVAAGHGVNPARCYGLPLRFAAAYGRIGLVEASLAVGARPNHYRGMTTALIGAAAMGHVGMMDLLLDHGADIDLAVPLSALRWRRPLAMVVRECCVGRTRDTIGTRRGGKGTGESALRSGRRRAGRTSSARMYKGVSR